MKQPHKHAEAIKAWADGKQVQVLTTKEWVDVKRNESCPPFWPEWEYRVKPDTVRYRVALFRSVVQTGTFFPLTTTSEDEAKDWQEKSKTLVRWLTDWVDIEV